KALLEGLPARLIRDPEDEVAVKLKVTPELNVIHVQVARSDEDEDIYIHLRK
ncbi:Prpf38b, partial [Symbiodinium microadriaticum]